MLFPVSLSIGAAFIVCAIIFVIISYCLQRRHNRLYPPPPARLAQNNTMGKTVRSDDEDTITKFHKETKHMDPNAGNDKARSDQTQQNLFKKMIELENP